MAASHRAIAALAAALPVRRGHSRSGGFAQLAYDMHVGIADGSDLLPCVIGVVLSADCAVPRVIPKLRRYHIVILVTAVVLPPISVQCMDRASRQARQRR